jgi:AraC family transcriptional regulator, transcriptional activator FtrA
MPTIVISVPGHRVTALALDGTSPLDLGAVAEVFGIDRGLAPQWYDLTVCGQRRGRVGTRGGLNLVVDRGLDGLAAADTIVVLPVARFVRERPDEALLAALASASAQGSRIVSLCLGSFVLAAAGLLDGRRATTHWALCQALGEAYPKVDVVPGVLYLDDGDVLTSGGVAAGIDLCLHLVRKDHGAEIANRLARALVFGPHREGGQAQFIEQPVPGTGSRRLGPALSWALEHLPENPTIGQLADAATMSRRTFYREFRASTGTTPHRWLAAQRVLAARRLLETTPLAIEEIAQHCGFGDAPLLRKHFTTQVGLSPTAYRRTFGHANASDLSR